MTDDQESSRREISGSLAMSAESSASFQGIVISDSQGEGTQRPFLELTDQGMKTQTALHEQYLERIKAEHELEQQAEDNKGRRLRQTIAFNVVIGAVVIGLIFAALLSIWTTDDETRGWAHNFVTLIFGGILGGLAGYFTGKRD